MNSKIFINYRREDSPWNSLALYQELIKHFGKDNVFKDFNTIEPGTDFVESIENALETCDVLLVLISESWLTIEDKRGNKRINNDDDFVRLEIAAALKRNICVIPILFDNAVLPLSSELPEDLKKLSRRQFVEIEKTRFETDTIKLVSAIKKVLNLQSVEREKNIDPQVNIEQPLRANNVIPESNPHHTESNFSNNPITNFKTSSKDDNVRRPSNEINIKTKPENVIILGTLSGLICSASYLVRFWYFDDPLIFVLITSIFYGIIYGVFINLALKKINIAARLNPSLLILFFVIINLFCFSISFLHFNLQIYGFFWGLSFSALTLFSFKIIYKINFSIAEYITTIIIGIIICYWSTFYPPLALFFLLRNPLLQIFISFLLYLKIRKLITFKP